MPAAGMSRVERGQRSVKSVFLSDAEPNYSFA